MIAPPSRFRVSVYRVFTWLLLAIRTIFPSRSKRMAMFEDVPPSTDACEYTHCWRMPPFGIALVAVGAPSFSCACWSVVTPGTNWSASWMSNLFPVVMQAVRLKARAHAANVFLIGQVSFKVWRAMSKRNTTCPASCCATAALRFSIGKRKPCRRRVVTDPAWRWVDVCRPDQASPRRVCGIRAASRAGSF